MFGSYRICRRRSARRITCARRSHAAAAPATPAAPAAVAPAQPAARTASPIPQPPAVEARAYILIDHDSGRVLAEEHADDRMEPASLTKLMTSYASLRRSRKAG